MVTFPEAAENWHYCSLLSPVVALGVNMIFQVIRARARKGAQFLRSIVTGCAAGAIALVIFEALLLAWCGFATDAIAFSLLVNVPTYGALSVCYFALANLGQTAIRIRLYAELQASPGGMSMQEIERCYETDTFAALRLRRLLEGGDLIQRDGTYFIARKRLLYFARLMIAAKVVLLGKKSEFEASRR